MEVPFFTHISTARSLSSIWVHELVVKDIVGKDYKGPRDDGN